MTLASYLAIESCGIFLELAVLSRQWRQEYRWQQRVRQAPRGWRRAQVRIQVAAERGVSRELSCDFLGHVGSFVFDPHWARVKKKSPSHDVTVKRKEEEWAGSF